MHYFLNKLISENIKKFYCPKKISKTPLGETGCLCNLYFLLTGCTGIQFFDSPLSQHSQLGHLWLPTPHCSALA